jgi:hypothetical protein
MRQKKNEAFEYNQKMKELKLEASLTQLRIMEDLERIKQEDNDRKEKEYLEQYQNYLSKSKALQ